MNNFPPLLQPEWPVCPVSLNQDHFILSNSIHVLAGTDRHHQENGLGKDRGRTQATLCGMRMQFLLPLTLYI